MSLFDAGVVFSSWTELSRQNSAGILGTPGLGGALGPFNYPDKIAPGIWVPRALGAPMVPSGVVCDAPCMVRYAGVEGGDPLKVFIYAGLFCSS